MSSLAKPVQTCRLRLLYSATHPPFFHPSSPISLVQHSPGQYLSTQSIPLQQRESCLFILHRAVAHFLVMLAEPGSWPLSIDSPLTILRSVEGCRIREEGKASSFTKTTSKCCELKSATLSHNQTENQTPNIINEGNVIIPAVVNRSRPTKVSALRPPQISCYPTSSQSTLWPSPDFSLVHSFSSLIFYLYYHYFSTLFDNPTKWCASAQINPSPHDTGITSRYNTPAALLPERQKQ